MMRKLPDDRYATPIQVVQVLEPFVDDLSTTGNDKERYPHSAKLGPEFSSGLPPSLDSKAAGTHQHAEELARVRTKMAAVSHNLGVDPVAPTDASFSANPLEPVASLLSPISNPETSDPELPLLVNLGPEPSLSERKNRPKTKTTTDYKASLLKVANPRGRLAPFWLWMLVMLTAVILVIVGFLALVKPFATPPGGTSPAFGVITNDKSRSPADSDFAKTSPTNEQPIVVRNESDNEQVFPAEKLTEAVQTAIGVRGWIELRNRKPLHLNGDQILDLISGRGRLKMQAAPGTQPVVEIELKDAKSWLTTGSAVSLELSGLTIMVKYQRTAATPAPPAVITAAGTVKIERCAFKVAGISSLKGSRAILSNGGKLNVNRCWFEGFDEAIDIVAMINAPAHIQQTMIVPAVDLAQSQGQPIEGYGWGVKLQIGAGGVAQTKSPQPHLSLEYCTFEGTGLIDAAKSPASFPLEIEVNRCAVAAKAILACRPALSPSSQIHWRGEGNQYDILGPFWIVLSATEVTPAFSSAVTDLNSWLLFAPGDNRPIPDKLVFLIDPKLRAQSREPRNFAVRAPAAPLRRPGADPELVGPWRRR
jgi:hypothetical protein